MTVNKVVNIEIAKQVFWVEEQGYDLLHTYLETLKLQLTKVDYGDEIFSDIELRFAELLYGVNEGKERAITAGKIAEFIDQVGFIDSEQEINDVPPQSHDLPQIKTYLDDHNKIVTGVCAGLSMRFSLPAFIFRIAFLGLSFVFGLGVLLYLILWFSYEKSDTPNRVLAAKGQQQTAKTLANSPEIAKSRFLVLQRILFLPFSVIGMLIHGVSYSVTSHRKFYTFILKNIVMLVLLFISICVGVGLVELHQDQLFPTWLQWILSGCVIYLTILTCVAFMREVYQNKPYRVVNKAFKNIAILPVVVIFCSVVYLMSELIDEKTTTVEAFIPVTANELTLTITDSETTNINARDVDIHIVNGPDSTNKVKLTVTYFSNGRGDTNLENNLKAIDYNYKIEGNSLILDRYFQLLPQAFNRGQRVYVKIELPQHLTLLSSHPMSVNIGVNANTIDYDIKNHGASKVEYFVADDYLHENDLINQQRVSHNERLVLLNKFCKTFFQKSEWQCHNTWEQSSENLSYFNVTVAAERTDIDMIRSVLDDDSVIEIKQLSAMSIKIGYLKQQHPQLDALHRYIEHLLHVKRLMNTARPAPS